jgi:hypothetical protein
MGSMPPAHDFSNRRPVDTELLSDIALKSLAPEAAYLKNIHFGQFVTRMTLAAIVRAMDQSVLGVSCRRLPRQMPFSATGEMAVSARVCGLVIWRRRRAVYIFANDAMDSGILTINPHLAVARSSAPIGPRKTCIAVISKHYFT